MAKGETNNRYRFSVPSGDKLVTSWIEQQSNLGFSLRVLIRAFVRDYGCQDATCLELGTEVKKRGRPPKAAKIQLGQMFDSDEIYAETREPVQAAEEAETGASAVDYDIADEPVDNTAVTVAAKPVQDKVPANPVHQAQPKMPAKAEAEIEEDSDGFIDPMSLLQ